MTPDLQQVLAEMLTVVKDAAQFGAAVAQRELPLLVQEYLRWAVIKGVLAVAAWASGFGLLVGLFITAIKRIGKSDVWAGVAILLGFSGTLLLFSLFVKVLPVIYDAIQAYVAPRVYLLEKLSEVVK